MTVQKLQKARVGGQSAPCRRPPGALMRFLKTRPGHPWNIPGGSSSERGAITAVPRRRICLQCRGG